MACEPQRIPADRPGGPCPNFRVSCYAVVLLPARCERCGCAAQASALWLPPIHDTRDLDDASDGPGWQVSSECRLLHEVTWIHGAARARLREWVPHLRFAPRPADGMHLWLNHCEHCGAPVCGFPFAGDCLAMSWLSACAEPPIEVIPVPEQLVATALSWTVGDLPDKVLDAIAAEAAREAASAAR